MDNLVDECPLNRGHKVLLEYNHVNCLLYRVAGCLLFRGCLSNEVNGELGLSESFVLSWISTVEGCPLSGVPMY